MCESTKRIVLKNNPSYIKKVQLESKLNCNGYCYVARLICHKTHPTLMISLNDKSHIKFADGRAQCELLVRKFVGTLYCVAIQLVFEIKSSQFYGIMIVVHANNMVMIMMMMFSTTVENKKQKHTLAHTFSLSGNSSRVQRFCKKESFRTSHAMPFYYSECVNRRILQSGT